MKDDLPKYFGVAIAFLVPGLIGLYALAFLSPTIAAWLAAVTSPEGSAGGVVFVLLGAAGMGVFLSGVRWWTIERWMPNCAPLDYSRISNESTLHALEAARVHHYQFYQFYANTLCALLALFAMWWSATDPRPAWSAVGLRALLLLVTSVVLFLSARDCWERYDVKTRAALQVPALVPQS